MVRAMAKRTTSTSSGLDRPNEPSVLILTSLASGDKHGYALTQDITKFAGVTLGPGTLYGAIARLEERGLIAPTPSDDRRQPYRPSRRPSNRCANWRTKERFVWGFVWPSRNWLDVPA
jgi:DNA-binding PadR family transcriptional regulator